MLELDLSTCKELIDTSIEGIVILNKEMDILYANEVFCNYCGYSKEEILNRNVISLIYEEDIEKVKEIIERGFKGEWVFDEFRYKTRAGEVRWASGIFRAFQIGGEVYGVGNYADLTELKSLLKNLEESERFYRELIEGSAAPMYIIQNGKFVFMNKKLEELSGYTREELFNMSPFDLVHPEDRESVFRKYVEREKGLREEESYSYRVVGKNREGWFSTVARRITFKGAPAVYVTGFDSTRFYNLNEELRKMNEMLKAVIDKLKENIDAMEQLVDGIRNPLANLLGYVELFGEKEVREKILEQVRRIDEIVDKIDQEWINSERAVEILRDLEKRSIG
ncbi:MAG: PAS domain S-box protein [Archaeoglobaceae archaeon]|nr:PAS domain S-box protein [Archaeoglobaceae archaeon]MDW8127641.1 PAS domain S-box protein [Archaeoglobaceae archaeon]